MTLDKLQNGIDILSDLFFNKTSEVYLYAKHPKSNINNMLPHIVWSVALLNYDDHPHKHAVGLLSNLLNCNNTALEKKYCGKFSESSIAYKDYVNQYYTNDFVSKSTRWMMIMSSNMHSAWASLTYKKVYENNVISAPIGEPYNINSKRCELGTLREIIRNLTVIAPVKLLMMNGVKFHANTYVAGYYDHKSNKEIPLEINYMDNNETYSSDASSIGDALTFQKCGFIVEDSKIYRDYYNLQSRISVVFETLSD